MRRNVIDADDAVGNGQVFNGTAGNDRFVGRSAADTEADTDFGIVGEEFSGQGGSDRFIGNGGNDSFFVDGRDRIIATEAEDGFVANVFGFDDGNNKINFRRFDADSIDDVTIEQTNNGTLVSVDGSQVFRLNGVDADEVSEDDFLFGRNNRNNNRNNDQDEEVVEEENDGGNGRVNNNNNGNFNVIDATGFVPNSDAGFFTNAQTINGTDGADLILAAGGGVQNDIRAGAGDDVAVLAGGGDLINLGDGADTIVAADAPGRISFTDFSPSEGDVLDFSRVSGVNSFDDISIRQLTGLAGGREDANLFEISGGDAPNILTNERLDEDDFIFAGDADAFVG